MERFYANRQADSSSGSDGLGPWYDIYDRTFGIVAIARVRQRYLEHFLSVLEFTSSNADEIKIAKALLADNMPVGRGMG